MFLILIKIPINNFQVFSVFIHSVSICVSILLIFLCSHKSETLPIESRYNFTTLALSPNGMLLIAVNERKYIIYIIYVFLLCLMHVLD